MPIKAVYEDNTFDIVCASCQELYTLSIADDISDELAIPCDCGSIEILRNDITAYESGESVNSYSTTLPCGVDAIVTHKIGSAYNQQNAQHIRDIMRAKNIPLIENR